MNADHLLDASRTVTMAVADDGTVVAARGGFGGFFDIDLAATIGTNVFARLTPDDADELAVYFLENAGESEETMALPIPFRIGLLDDAGMKHFVDVIATGRHEDDDSWYWVVNLVPVALNGSITRSLDLELAGAARETVKKMLCEELIVDNHGYTTRWFLFELPQAAPIEIHHSRAEDAVLAEALLGDARRGWQPWSDVEPEGIATVARDAVPDATRAILTERGWRRVLVAPVHVNGRLVAALVHTGRVPASYPVDVIKRNVAARIGGLVRATALLLERWDEQDQLRFEATSDALTGLRNGRVLAEAMKSSDAPGVLLFVDVDLFKMVNDEFGHRMGDRVLVEVSGRILDACREEDVVARVGGDEFAVLLRGADQALAHQIGRRIIDAVSAPLDIDGGPDSVSVSIGLATTGRLDPLDAADQAMLRAKRSGRSRLELADPS